jgi:hypothetical protein
VPTIRRVFLSSTAKDLKEYREAAYQAIEGPYHHCDRMENWGAQDDEADHFCAQRVEECDVFVGIVGHCYGSLPKGKRKSYTEREYDVARRTGKPRLMFVAPDDFPVPASLIEPDEKRAKQAAFRKRVCSEGVCAPFRSPDELVAAVQQALRDWEAAKPRARATRASASAAGFVAEYRERLWGLYTNWDLGRLGVAEAGTTRAFEARLDEMYVPLRLQPDSPALALGFEPIPFEQIGPYQDDLRASWPIVEARGAREQMQIDWSRT